MNEWKKDRSCLFRPNEKSSKYALDMSCGIWGTQRPLPQLSRKKRVAVCIAGTQNFPPLLRNCRNGTTRRRYIESFLFSPPPRRPPKVPRSPKTKPTVSFLSIIPIYQQLSLKAVIKTVVPLQLSCNIGGEFWFSKSSLDLKIDPLTNFNCER